LEKGILEALKMDSGKAARQRVMDMFTISLREEKLLKLVGEVVTSK